MRGQVPEVGLDRVRKVLVAGCIKYGPANWRGIGPLEHFDHAREHLKLYAEGDRGEDHLAHAATRILFCIETLGAIRDDLPSQ